MPRDLAHNNLANVDTEEAEEAEARAHFFQTEDLAHLSTDEEAEDAQPCPPLLQHQNLAYLDTEEAEEAEDLQPYHLPPTSSQ